MKKLMAAMLILVAAGMMHVKAGMDDYSLAHGTHEYTGLNGSTYLTYTSTHNVGVTNLDKLRYGHIFFTVKDDVPADKQLAVQFLATDISIHGNIKPGLENFTITDYGIYLYDPNDGPATAVEHELWSITESGNNFTLKPGDSFGIYYKDEKGVVHKTTTVENGSGNYVSNWDDDNHIVTYTDEDGNTVTATTGKHFLCMFDSRELVWPHWEFILQTTLDDPYYPVDPNTFPGNGTVVVPQGQPLPGMLATLLIGGLCTTAVRKKNKKQD